MTIQQRQMTKTQVTKGSNVAMTMGIHFSQKEIILAGANWV